jgi:hypothetical protein
MNHTIYGVNPDLFEAWSAIVEYNRACGAHDLHAACDCRSYSQHQSIAHQPPDWNLDPCTRPLATVLHERELVNALAARQICQRQPWVTYDQARQIIDKTLPAILGQPDWQHYYRHG